MSDQMSERVVPSERSWIGRSLRVIERVGLPPFSEIHAELHEVPAAQVDITIHTMLTEGFVIEPLPGYLSLGDAGETWISRGVGGGS